MTFRGFIKYSLLFLLALAVALGTFVFLWYRSGNLQKTVITEVSKKIISVIKEKTVLSGNKNAEQDVNLIQDLLGTTEPRTYLFLFLNNTELRPGGGFIGTYAVVNFENAYPDIIKVEGTEIIDNLAPKNFPSVPPQPIKDYLGVDRWYFRDSNWSPDFVVSAANALSLYSKENGEMADDIDLVIGFTPTVIEELLRISGPVTINGIQFTADNFTEKLEYEVEYGFAHKGISFDDRKKMLGDLTRSIVMNSFKNALVDWAEYKDMVERMFVEKQIMAYSPEQKFQEVFEAKNWAGQMSGAESDYLLWVDANLGALKTDVSIDRTLSYEFSPDKKGGYIVKAKMTYVHKGVFDWRTTRYRDYARLYVPVGSRLIKATGAMKKDQSTEPGKIDQGIENGRQWFGSFISIEPGKTGELSFEFQLAPSVVHLIRNNQYKLLVQKQLGTNNTRLTLWLNFDKKLSFASPGEDPKKHGDSRYEYSGILKKDLDVEIRTQ